MPKCDPGHRPHAGQQTCVAMRPRPVPPPCPGTARLLTEKKTSHLGQFPCIQTAGCQQLSGTWCRCSHDSSRAETRSSLLSVTFFLFSLFFTQMIQPERESSLFVQLLVHRKCFSFVSLWRMKVLVSLIICRKFMADTVLPAILDFLYHWIIAPNHF